LACRSFPARKSPASSKRPAAAPASADHLATTPDQASFEEAAALVIGGGTAHEGLIDRGRLQSGDTVLITAAAGGVGSVAVQIAAAAGARPPGRGKPGQP